MNEYQQITESEKTMLELVQGRRFLDLERVPLICRDIAQIKEMLEKQGKSLVTQDQFWPVKTLVYGMVGIILMGVVVALMALVIKK